MGHLLCLFFYVFTSRERDKDRQTNRQTETQRETETEKDRGREMVQFNDSMFQLSENDFTCAYETHTTLQSTIFANKPKQTKT